MQRIIVVWHFVSRASRDMKQHEQQLLQSEMQALAAQQSAQLQTSELIEASEAAARERARGDHMALRACEAEALVTALQSWACGRIQATFSGAPSVMERRKLTEMPLQCMRPSRPSSRRLRLWISSACSTCWVLLSKQYQKPTV